MKISKITVFLYILFLTPLFGLGTVNAANQTMQANLNVIDILASQFPTFYGLVKRAGYDELIKNNPNITIFAPTEEAFAFLKSEEMLGLETYNTIFNDISSKSGIQRLRNVLNLHIFPGRILSKELEHMEYIQPYEGRKLTLHIVNGQLHINNSAIAEGTDIIGSNGVVHAINAVIL